MKSKHFHFLETESFQDIFRFFIVKELNCNCSKKFSLPLSKEILHKLGITTDKKPLKDLFYCFPENLSENIQSFCIFAYNLTRLTYIMPFPLKRKCMKSYFDKWKLEKNRWNFLNYYFLSDYCMKHITQFLNN